eukprot:3149980-Rhodomonas_salina.1
MLGQYRTSRRQVAPYATVVPGMTSAGSSTICEVSTEPGVAGASENSRRRIAPYARSVQGMA